MFSLSVELSHKNPVRAITYKNDDLIMCGESKGQVFSQTRQFQSSSMSVDNSESNSEKNISLQPNQNFIQKQVQNQNQNVELGFAAPKTTLLFCLEHFLYKDGSNIEKSLFASGGNDNKCSLQTTEGDLFAVLDHKNGAVNSICQAGLNTIVTGAFDSKARIQNINSGNAQLMATLEDHVYGVEVCVLETGELVAGSNKHLKIYRNNCLYKTINDAHTHQIRRILRHPRGFVTCANDGYVKIQSKESFDLLVSIEAHPVVADKPSFIYSLGVQQDNGDIVSIGEDRMCRIQSSDGALKQCIKHPSPIRCVTVLPCGDLITGSDTTLRIQSKDVGKQASPSVIEAYEKLLRIVENEENKKLKESEALKDETPKLFEGKPEEILNTPGTRHGEQRILKMASGLFTVFQQDAHNNTWQEVEHINKASKEKVEFEGEMYDHVVHIWITEERQESIGFNVDDDPKETAIRFCERYSIDRSNVEQIIQHLNQFADPIARAKKLATEDEKRRNQFVYIPIQKNGRFNIEISTEKQNQMKEKLIQINQELLRNNHYAAINECSPVDNAVFKRLLDVCCDTSRFHTDLEFDNALKQMVLRILSQPTENILPVFDMLRLLMCHLNANKVLTTDLEFRSLLLKHVRKDSEGSTKLHLMMFCKICFNWIAKRSRSKDERYQNMIPEDVIEFLIEVMTIINESKYFSEKSVINSLSLLLYNIVLWFGKIRFLSKNSSFDERFYFLVLHLCFKCLKSISNQLKENCFDKILQHMLVSIGTIAYSSSNINNKILLKIENKSSETESLFDQTVLEFCFYIKTALRSSNQALQQIGSDLKKQFPKIDVEK